MTQNSISDEIIILNVKDWQTADKWAVGFSREHGKISFIAYGAKYPKSTAGRLVQPFAVLNAEFYEGNHLYKLKGCTLAQVAPTFKLDELAYGALAAEATELLTEDSDPKEEIYEQLLQLLPFLKEHNPRLVTLSYLVKLLELTGVGPVFERCVICGRPIEAEAAFSNEQGGMVCKDCGGEAGVNPFHQETRILWRQLLDLDFQNPQALKVKGGSLMELERIVNGFITYQVDRPLKCLEFLAQLPGT
jgi:DNA repair protein RecO (recombination protein O)